MRKSGHLLYCFLLILFSQTVNAESFKEWKPDYNTYDRAIQNLNWETQKACDTQHQDPSRSQLASLAVQFADKTLENIGKDLKTAHQYLEQPEQKVRSEKAEELAKEISAKKEELRVSVDRLSALQYKERRKRNLASDQPDRHQKLRTEIRTKYEEISRLEVTRAQLLKGGGKLSPEEQKKAEEVSQFGKQNLDRLADIGKQVGILSRRASQCGGVAEGRGWYAAIGEQPQAPPASTPAMSGSNVSVPAR